MAKETTTHTGTGSPITLAGAVSPFSTFVARATSELSGGSPWSDVWYTMTDNAGNWEIGNGTLIDAASDTITRNVVRSSNSDAAVNWAAGTKDIYSWPAAEELTGTAVQLGFVESTSAFAITTRTPLQDGSTPTIGEGSAIINFSWTPTRTDTVTLITFHCPIVELDNSNVGSFTLWYGSTLVGTATAPTEGGTTRLAVPMTMNALHDHAATTTVTIQVRCGLATSGSLRINRTSAQATPYGAGNQIMLLQALEVVN
jgi:hypothetical protein